MKRNMIHTLPSGEEKSTAGGEGRDLRYRLDIAIDICFDKQGDEDFNETTFSVMRLNI